MSKENTISRFFTQAWAGYKGLFHWLNWPAYISNVFLRPVIQIILYSILGKFAIGTEKTQTLIIGLAVQQMAFILIGGITQSYYNEIGFRTLPFVYVSKINRFENFISRSVLHFPNALLTFISGLFTAWVIINLNFGMVNWAGFIVAVLVITTSITAFAQLSGIFTLLTQDWILLQSYSEGILFAFTGAIIPISIFPAFVQELTKLLPITNGLFAVRATFTGAPLAEVSGYLLREAITGLIYFAVAAVAFLWVERWAKRTGILYAEI